MLTVRSVSYTHLIEFLLNNSNVPASVKAAMGGTIPQYSATMATVIVVIGPIMVCLLYTSY